MDKFSTALVLTRVLNTGVIMSIEKNEKELTGLSDAISKMSGRQYVSLTNSFTAGVHTALFGQDIVYGDSAHLAQATQQEQKFIKWLGVHLNQTKIHANSYDVIRVTSENLSQLGELVKQSASPTLVLDFTPLKFGPCAAILTSSKSIWERGERLKIFGFADLRTMWTEKEEASHSPPAVQFNYRLSPLVASCIRISLMREQK